MHQKIRVKKRDTRYQGAIVRDHKVLLIKHQENDTGRSYWILPGGGIEPGETEEDCIRREMKEETNLEVEVATLLMKEPAKGIYRWRKTYHCTTLVGEPRPGFEPEADAASWYSIVAVKWFDLRDESGWDAELTGDSITYNQLMQVRKKLGYLP